MTTDIATPSGAIHNGDRSVAGQRATAARAPEDVLIFEQTDLGFTLVGGDGRGAGWAGIVDLGPADDALVGRSWRRGTAERLSGRRPRQVAGPYYARHAIAVPVGQRHVVVFGAERPITLGDSELVRLAAAAVDRTDGVSADKLLADELELVHALRVLMAYRPVTVRETVRHVATVAARALSCELAVLRVQIDGRALVESVDVRSMSPLANPDAQEYLATMDLDTGPQIVQVAPRDPDIFGVEVASHLTLPLAGPGPGALALGHTVAGARGFTSLCQRIGRAIADAAELLISQAHTREQLATERDLLARLVRTDALTGGANRHVWDDEVTAWRANGTRPSAFVVYCDLDGLKAVNDQFGHAAGDALIRGAANLLVSSVRESDLVVRIGGDEFVVLLTPADATTARRVVARMRRAQHAWRVTEYALIPQLSIGLAAVVEGDLEGARCAADRAMYVNKRRRSSRRSQASIAAGPDRRSVVSRAGRPGRSSGSA
jgi:diguanylate cyclase (GGDEF)-like protein